MAEMNRGLWSMRQGRLAPRFIVLLIATAACAPRFNLRDPQTLEFAIRTDLQTLCERAADGSIVSWGQAGLITDEVGAITIRIDQGDPSARCELGQLMRQHEPETCSGSVSTLIHHCASEAESE